MHSIRTKTILLNIIAIFLSVVVTTIIATITIANTGHSNVDQSLSLLCESGKNNLNYYFRSVEQSLSIVSKLINSDLKDVSDSEFNTYLHEHTEKMRTTFNEVAESTPGVLTYYYRYDPSLYADTHELGFWYTNLEGKGFEEHAVTDIGDDKFECKWFYEPKESGKPSWLPPYVTDNLDIYVISYNVPVYRNNTFIGVVGIEIDYMTLGEQIKDIKVLQSGFAFIVENKLGTIIYHPKIDILGMPEEERPLTPPEFRENLLNGNHHIIYTYEGVKKHCHWLELNNGMDIVVTVPQIEVNQTWQSVILQVVISGIVLIAVFTVITILFSRHITKPLKELTVAAEEINKGNYDIHLEHNSNDEIGVLTTTVNTLITHLKDYINDLNSMAYADALTSVKNKGAFDLRIEEMQKQIEAGEKLEFAIAMLDCDELKDMNDSFGHDKGDIYLRNSCNLISRIFEKSDIYRIGGDEFVAILVDEEYKNREILRKRFIKKSADICALSKEPWEKIRVSIGIAAYDPSIDKNVNDVLIHADHLMYVNKRDRKKYKL